MTGGISLRRGFSRFATAGDSLERVAASLDAWWTAPSPRRDLIVTIASASGYGLALAAFVLIFTLPNSDGGIGYDAHSYYVAGQNVLHGQPLYWPTAIDSYGPYRYPPLFAQMWAPFTLLPELAFHWLWRAVCAVCLFYLAGSWRALGLWLLFPLTLSELSSANVTFPVAAMTLAAFRGDVRWLPWAAFLKIGPILAFPYIWLRRPERRRTLIASTLVLLGVVAVSVIADPASWRLYIDSLGWQGVSELHGGGLVSILPTAAGDFLLRAGIAVALVAVAVVAGLVAARVRRDGRRRPDPVAQPPVGPARHAASDRQGEGARSGRRPSTHPGGDGRDRRASVSSTLAARG